MRTLLTMLNMDGWLVVALMEKSNRVSAMIRSDAVAYRYKCDDFRHHFTSIPWKIH